MRRSTILLATTLLSVSALTAGCGGNSTDAYCSELKSAKSDFASLDSGDASGFEDALDEFETLGDKAPDEVSEDWKTLNDAFGEFRDALDEAGIKPDDLDKLSSGDLPEGVTQEDIASLSKQVEGLSDQKVEDAGDSIEKHAKSECDIDLSDS